DGAVLYGLKSTTAASGSGPPTLLFRANPDGSSLTSLGAVTLDNANIDADALAASPTQGLVGFEQTASGSRLIKIDSTTAVATAIGPPLFGREIRGATFAQNGDLWSIDVPGKSLVRVSTATGEELGSVGLTVGGLPLSPDSNSDLAVRFDGQMLLVSANQFYSVDTSTGNATLLFTDNQNEPTPGSVAPPTLGGAVVGGYLGTEQIFAL